MLPLRILQVCWPSLIGGVERNLIEYADAFQRRGNYVVTTSIEGEGPLSEAFKKRNLPFIALGMTRPLRISRFLLLIKIIIEQKFDVIHIYGFKAQLLTTYFAKFLRIPVVIVGLRSTGDWRKQYNRIIEIPTYPFINGWIAVSNEVKEAFIKREKFPPSKIKVVHNGINTQLFCPVSPEQYQSLRNQKKIPDDIFLIGYVANLKEDKGHDVLIDALALLKKRFSRFKVLLVGIDYLKGEIQKYARERNLTKEIEFMGYIEEVRPILSMLDLFVIPSLIEGLPMSLLEAMAVGIPVIATPVGGIPEVIVNEKNGILVPIKDPERLSNKILELMQNKKLRADLALNALQTIKEKFSLDSKITEILKFYTSFLRKT